MLGFQKSAFFLNLILNHKLSAFGGLLGELKEQVRPTVTFILHDIEQRRYKNKGDKEVVI